MITPCSFVIACCRGEAKAPQEAPTGTRLRTNLAGGFANIDSRVCTVCTRANAVTCCVAVTAWYMACAVCATAYRTGDFGRLALKCWFGHGWVHGRALRLVVRHLASSRFHPHAQVAAGHDPGGVTRPAAPRRRCRSIQLPMPNRCTALLRSRLHRRRRICTCPPASGWSRRTSSAVSSTSCSSIEGPWPEDASAGARDHEVGRSAFAGLCSLAHRRK